MPRVANLFINCALQKARQTRHNVYWEAVWAAPFGEPLREVPIQIFKFDPKGRTRKKKVSGKEEIRVKSPFVDVWTPEKSLDRRPIEGWLINVSFAQRFLRLASSKWGKS